jgi:hypothetical protein
MPAFFKSSVDEFLHVPSDQVAGILSSTLINAFSGDHSRQLKSWKTQIELLKLALNKVAKAHPKTGQWGILFEYPLLRLQRRLDVVLLAGNRVLVIEFKVGGDSYQTADIQQVEDYALDLRDFHEASHHLCIFPILCTTNAPNRTWNISAKVGVASICLCNTNTLADLLVEVSADENHEQLEIDRWEASQYRPVPSIIEAAELLYAGHKVREVAHASANPENLGTTTDKLIEIIASAQQGGKHVVAFVTGVPGSGKTLVGLNAIHDPRFRQDGRESGAFLSGNTPLVTVLREALARDDAMRNERTLRDARREVRTEIQGLMNYLQEYLDSHPNKPPIDHVIVFDEAQRAWDAVYGAQKFERPKSEPALFLEIMDRHPDWSVIIALVGGGQEINRGERGLSEWGIALKERNFELGENGWNVVAAPEVVTGGDATAWQSLFKNAVTPDWVKLDKSLHLGVSIRSYRCLATTQWVNELLEGNISEAKAVARQTEEFPILFTRSLSTARNWLRENARGTRRCGLVASSGARRLRAEGLGVTLSATELSNVANWYLLPKGDIRSSFALEVSANEYTCQGLELDYVGVCWGGDLMWCDSNDLWTPRKLNGSKWQTVRNEDMQTWIKNKYRVLLTRARLGTIIWVPSGDDLDNTRDPKIYNEIARQIASSGLLEI